MKLQEEDIIKNKWYMIGNYGYRTAIRGKAVDVCNGYVTLKFYWGGFFRTRQAVEIERLVGECEPPSFFSNY